MYNSDEIIKGIKVNDEKIWKFLYKYFYDIVVKHVTGNSGSKEDADDLIQDTFFIIFKNCQESFHHDNILAFIMIVIKNKWIDKLRKRNDIVDQEIDDNIKGDTLQYEPIQKSGSNVNLTKIFNISKNLNEKLKRNCRVEDFLDYSNLNNIQKRMIEILMDEKITNHRCRKLLMLTHYLPISDNETIADEMGYIKEHTEKGIKKGLETLKTQKTRCLKKFKESLGIKKAK